MRACWACWRHARSRSQLSESRTLMVGGERGSSGVVATEYQEYLELFQYFGRGGLKRLDRSTFDQLNAEFNALLARPRPLDDGDIARVGELKALLLRDRPRLSALRQTTPRASARGT